MRNLHRFALFFALLTGAACQTAAPKDDPAPATDTPAADAPAGAAPAAAEAPPRFVPAEPDLGAPHPFGADDLIALDRVGAPVPSPDGKSVVYGRRTLKEDRSGYASTLWVLDVDRGDVRQLTFHPKGAGTPAFSPDGATVFFQSGRSGSSQIWSVPLAGGEPVQVTDLPVGIQGYRLAPDGKSAVVIVDVFVDCADLACTQKRLEERAQGATGMVYDRVFVRHWDTWKDGRRQQLFRVNLTGEAAPVRVTVGLDADVPPKPWHGPEAFVFTPDGNGIVFVAKDGAADKKEPWSTNYDLYHASLQSPAPPEKLTANPAWDDAPVFSPDGNTLAYVAMARPGFEADRMVIHLMNWADKTVRPLTAKWDRSVSEMVFSADGKTLFVNAYDTGEKPVFAVDVASGQVQKVLSGGHHTALAPTADRLWFLRNDLAHPDEVWSAALDGTGAAAATHVNDQRLGALQFGAYEQFSFKGAKGDTVYGWVFSPPGHDGAAKRPLAFLIHGGPQGSFANRFHTRWNPQVFAGAGYATVMIDFHGSVGYGQKFTDAITGDWGGAPLEDLKKGLSAVTKKYPWVDGGNACALGASYGGYMVNWVAGAWPDQFKCLVNHDGIFDQRAMYYATEELWFPEWEHGGPYFDAPKAHEKHNPANLVKKWKTPMLVIHGLNDHRVPLEQGLMTFNALQRRGIESRLLYYPDENHWVLQPQNSVQWHREVLGWLSRHTTPAQ